MFPLVLGVLFAQTLSALHYFAHSVNGASVDSQDARNSAEVDRQTKSREKNDLLDIEELLDDLDWRGQMGQMAQMDVKLLLNLTEPVQFNQIVSH